MTASDYGTFLDAETIRYERVFPHPIERVWRAITEPAEVREWFMPWSQYVKGSALDEAVQAGPQGSTFVSPSSLPADTATAPLQTSAAGNFYAGAAGLG